MSHTAEPPSGVILVVEDDASLAELIATTLNEQGLQTARVTSGAEAIAWLADHTPALLLLDYALPDMTGLQVITKVGRPLPFLVTTGAGDEHTAVELMKHGARDYLIKDSRFLDSLPLAVRHTLKQLEVERQLAQAEASLRESEKRYRTIIDATSDFVFLKDEAFRYLISNLAYCAFLGKTEAEVIGRTDFDLLPNEVAERCRAGDLDALTRKASVSSQETVGADTFQTVKFPVSLPSGSLGVGGFISDITARKRAEAEQVRQLDELRRWQTVTLGREGRIAELKREVTALAARLGEKPIYDSGAQT